MSLRRELLDVRVGSISSCLYVQKKIKFVFIGIHFTKEMKICHTQILQVHSNDLK
jgi:hypothetical protein